MNIDMEWNSRGSKENMRLSSSSSLKAKLYKESPIKAQDLLQHFSDGVLNHAIEVADELVEELFTRLTEKIQKEYLFHGA